MIGEIEIDQWDVAKKEIGVWKFLTWMP